jgi:hypothetical protein
MEKDARFQSFILHISLRRQKQKSLFLGPYFPASVASSVPESSVKHRSCWPSFEPRIQSSLR